MPKYIVDIEDIETESCIPTAISDVISDHTKLTVITVTEDVMTEDEPVYNALTPPWAAQAYANLHAKIESFIIDAIEVGADEDQLRTIMLSDVDQLIANHGK